MMVVVPFRRGRWAPIAVLSLATVMYAVARVYASMDYHSFLYSLFAWGNALLLFAWLLPDAVRALRQRGEEADRSAG
jgi:hypothetical protein